MKKMNSYIFFIILLMNTSSIQFLRNKDLLKNQRYHKTNKSTSEDCNSIYSISEEYEKNTIFKDYNLDEEKFEVDYGYRLYLFFNDIIIDDMYGFIDIKAFQQTSEEFNRFQQLKEFFQKHNIPNKYNIESIKKCCLTSVDVNGKNALNDICKHFIEGFSRYRMFLKLEYIEKAFKEAMQNQEYVIGEVPLSEEQKKIKQVEIMKKNKGKPFSEYWMKIMNPIYIYKGGQKMILDEGSFDMPSMNYRESEYGYIQKLKEKLEKACFISSFVPSECQEITRIHGAFSQNFESLGIIYAFFKEGSRYFDNYYLVCLSKAEFISIMESSNKIVKQLEDKDERGGYRYKFNAGKSIPQRIKHLAIKVEIDEELNLHNYELRYKLSSYHPNVVRSFNLQRLLIDNINNRFQNDVMATNYKEQTYCLTFGDCFGIYFTFSGFRDNKLDGLSFTGIEEVDNILMKVDSEKKKDLEKLRYHVSLGLGMIPLLEFWERARIVNLDEKLIVEENIDFSYGTYDRLNQEYLDSSNFFESLMPRMMMRFQQLLSIDEWSLVSKALDLPKIVQKAFEEFKEFRTNLKETIQEIRNIKNSIENSVSLDPDDKNPFRKSLKNNEIFTLMTIEAIDDITRIQFEFGVAMNQFKKFMLKTGIGLSYGYMEFFNEAAQDYYTQKEEFMECHSLNEAMIFLGSQGLNQYSKYYPDFKKGEKLTNEQIVDYAKAINHLTTWFFYFEEALMSFCILDSKLMKSNIYQEIPKKFVLRTRKGEDEIIEEYEKIKGNPDSYKLDTLILNLEILLSFANKSYNLFIRSEGTSIFQLSQELLEIEEDFMKYMIGYEIGNKKQNILTISKIISHVFQVTLLDTHLKYIFKSEIVPLLTDKE